MSVPNQRAHNQRVHTKPPPPAARGAQGPRLTLLEVADERIGVLRRLLQRSGTLSVDDVHDLRVASRRLTEVARLLEVLMEPPAPQAVDQALKTLRKAAGELRDLDVLDEHLRKLRLPVVLRKIVEEILAKAPEKRAALGADLRNAMAEPSLTAALVVLAQVIGAQADRRQDALDTLETALAERARRRHRQVAKAFGRAARKQTPAALHEARIAAKKLRYVLELADEAAIDLPGRHPKHELKLLKSIQKGLGEHHDTHVLVATLQRHLEARDEKAKKAWEPFCRRTEEGQAHRAADFFMRSYQWRNGS